MDARSAAPPVIIDAHCHIASGEHTPRSFVEGVISNMMVALLAQGVRASARQLAAMYHQKMQDPLCDQLVAEMAEAGISKSILLVPDFTYALKDCELTIEESFLKHRDVLLRHPGKFEVFGGVDPRWGADGVALFERALVEFGFRGLKLYPPCGYSPSDPGLFPYYELCAKHRVPVLLHIGPTSPTLAFDTSNPFLLDEAARRFPGVNFILAHASVSFTEECVMQCSHRPNVYLDVSGYQSMLRADGSARVLRNIVSRGINHKVLFGTDWPVFRLQGNQKSFVDVLIEEGGPFSDLSDRERDLVLYKNIERLLTGAAPAARSVSAASRQG
ncbi:amidohydrolase family protein [Corallococcus llansteffanensis]|nr:amidohydrolase family protein [Corallococcus llansteffanensis]